MRSKITNKYTTSLLWYLMNSLILALLVASRIKNQNAQPKKISLSDLSLEEAKNIVSNGNSCIQAVYTVTEEQIRDAVYVRTGLIRELKTAKAEADDSTELSQGQITWLDLNDSDVKTALSAGYLPTHRKAIYTGTRPASNTALVFSIYPGKSGDVLSAETQSSLGRDEIEYWATRSPYEFKGTLIAQAPIEEGKKMDCSKYSLR